MKEHSCHISVLVLAIDFKPNIGGVAEFTHNLAEHMGQLPGFKTAVLTTLSKGAEPKPQVTRYYTLLRDRFSHSERKPLRALKRAVRITKTVKLTSSHILLMNQYDYLSFTAALTTKVLGRQFCIYTHGLDIGKRLSIIGRVKRILTLKLASRVFCNSRHTRSIALRNGASESRAVIVPPGVQQTTADNIVECGENSLLRGKIRPGNRSPIILTLGRLVERKGVDRVLEALPSIVRDYPNLLYVVAGDGPYRQQLAAMTAREGLSQNVLFAGLVSETEKRELYGLCDLFVMPNRELDNGDIEGFGMVFIEANAFGKPVIAGASGGARDAVLHGVTGLLVDPNSPREIAEAIRTLIENPGMAHRLGQNGRLRVMSEYSWSAIASKISDQLKQALGYPVRSDEQVDDNTSGTAWT